MIETDLVSVIVPAYNMCTMIDETIASILNQSYKNIEILIIDDGSVDETSHVISKYISAGSKYDPRIQYLYKSNGGRVSAINLGIKEAKGRFVTYVDADDTLPVDSISDRINILTYNPDCKTVYGDANCIDANSIVFKIRKSRSIVREKEIVDFFINPIVSSSVLFRRDLINIIGEFDSSFKRLTDVCMNIALYRAGKMCYLPKVVYNFRTYKRKEIYRLRINTLLYFYKIINKYYSGKLKYYYFIKQTIFQICKLMFELVSVHK